MVLNLWACVLALLRCVVCVPTEGRPMKVDDCTRRSLGLGRPCQQLVFPCWAGARLQNIAVEPNGKLMVLNFWACVLALLRCVVCVPTGAGPMKVDDLDAAIARARLALSEVSVSMLGQERRCKNIAVEPVEN